MGHKHRQRVRRGLVVSACVIVAYILLNGLYAWKLRVAADSVVYHKIVFSDREFQHPVFVPTNDQEWAFELVDPEWRGVRAYARGYIPIIRWVRVYRVVDPDEDRDLFFAPSMWYEADRLAAKPDDGVFRLLMFWLSVVTLSGALIMLVRHHEKLWPAVGGIVLLRLTSLFWTYWLFGFFTVDSGDEVRYLHIAHKLLDWSYVLLDSRYSIGNPLLYMPLLMLRPSAWTEFGFVGLTTVLYFLTFGLGVVTLWMWFVKRLSLSVGLSVWSGLALVLYPWLWRVFHVPTMEIGLFSFFGLWLVEPLEKTFIDFYYFTNLVGYNALSDTPALFFALLSILLLHRSVTRHSTTFWAGLIFGFSVMIRITNVFLLLPVAVVLLGTSSKKLVSCGIQFLFGATLAFAPQLLWNRALFGDALFFGYRLIEADYKGFEISNLRNGVPIVGGVFQQLMAFSALSLVIARRRFVTLSTVLAASIVPLLVFYAGYHAVKICPVRFVLTPVCAMILASVLVFMFKEERPAAWACLGLLALIIPGKAYAAYVVPVPWWTPACVAGALGVVLFLRSRRWPYAAFCCVVVVGSPWLTFAILCAVSGWVVVRGLIEEQAVVEIRDRFL